MYESITPKGIAIFPKLKKPDFFKDQSQGYTLRLKLTPEETNEIKAKLEAFLMEKVRTELNGQQPRKTLFMPFHEEKDGSETIKFKSKDEFKDKNGNIVKRVIPIFDFEKNLIESEEEIPHNSIVRVCYTPIFWNQLIGYGITLRINSVQLILKTAPKKKPKTAEDFGFQNESEYVQKYMEEKEETPEPEFPQMPETPAFSYQDNERLF